jgi:hypothetical protein
MNKLLQIAQQAGFDVALDNNIYNPDTSDEFPLTKYINNFARILLEEYTDHVRDTNMLVAIKYFNIEEE